MSSKIRVNVVDIHEAENDGECGVFVVVVCVNEKEWNTAMVFYDLRMDICRMQTSTLDPRIVDAVVSDKDVKGEMREAVMAERDARLEEAANRKRAASRAEQKAKDEEKWNKN